ncbi:MAG: HAMP domain-containing sensor histidine kinase [Pirellulaceae bacterium]
MDQLPTLHTSQGDRRLPLNDETAVGLIDALLESDAPARRDRLAALLRGDRWLALWSLLQAESSPGRTPPTVDSLADWLGRAALDLLVWPQSQSECESSQSECESPSRDQQPRKGARPTATREAESALADEQYLQSLRDESGDSLAEQALAKTPSDSATAGRGGRMLRRLVERLRRWRELEDDFAQALEREKLDSLKELAYGASHEINNPLANISTRAQTLLRDETDPDRRQKLAVINSQAFRAHEMISDMMLFARPPAIVPEAVDLADVVGDVRQELAAMAREQSTLLRTSTVEAGRCVVTADGTQLRVALKALVQNSLEALGAGGQVEVSIEVLSPNGELPHGEGASHPPLPFRILVADNGPGLTPEVRRHLFDPFYSGREAGRGLGFGLSKCWRIVTSHGGRIDVESEPGRGATFTVWLPAECGLRTK